MTRPALRVLTLNAGLLRISALGRTVFEVPHVEERLRALPAALQAQDADVICLQEVFAPRHRDLLVSALRATHPHAVREERPRLGWTHGLLVVSRHPLRDVAFRPFTAQHLLQRWYVPQGALAATVDVPGGPLQVLDVHAAAGGWRSPEDRQVEDLRDRQVRELGPVPGGRPRLLCGDLNCGPEVSARNYRALLDCGWTDAVAATGTTTPSWSPTNPLNARSRYASSPPQRIDHVLLDAAAEQRYRPVRAAVVLTEPVVAAGGEVVPVSDHSAVVVDLETA